MKAFYLILKPTSASFYMRGLFFCFFLFICAPVFSQTNLIERLQQPASLEPDTSNYPVGNGYMSLQALDAMDTYVVNFFYPHDAQNILIVNHASLMFLISEKYLPHNILNQEKNVYDFSEFAKPNFSFFDSKLLFNGTRFAVRIYKNNEYEKSLLKESTVLTLPHEVGQFRLVFENGQIETCELKSGTELNTNELGNTGASLSFSYDIDIAQNCYAKYFSPKVENEKLSFYSKLGNKLIEIHFYHTHPLPLAFLIRKTTENEPVIEFISSLIFNIHSDPDILMNHNLALIGIKDGKIVVGKSDLDYYASVPLKAIVTIPPDISFEKVFIQVKDIETSQIGTIEVTPWWFNIDIFATFLSHQKFSLF